MFAFRTLLFLVLLQASGPSLARAQAPTPDDTTALGLMPRWELGFGLLVAEPVGELSRHIGGGAGFRLSGLADLGRAGGIALRVDGIVVSYGKTSETHVADLNGAFVTVERTTENTIASVTVGPQATFGQGRVRGLVGASVGSTQFATTTSVWSGGKPVPIAASRDLERHTWVVSAGAGLRVAIRERSRYPMGVEIDGRYLRNGRTEYLTAEGVRGLPDGSVVLKPVVSEANLWTLHLGLVLGLR